MKVTVDSKEILRAINFAALNERSKTDTDKYIDKVFVDVVNGAMTLSRFGNHACKKSKPIKVDSDRDGSFQIDYMAFNSVVTKIVSRFDEVFLEKVGNELKVTAGRINTSLVIAEMLKPIADEDAAIDDEICVQTADLIKLISEVRNSTAKGDVRYYLNGICFQTDSEQNNLLHAIATDGHRMTKGQCEFLAQNYEKERSVIISNECVGYLDKLLRDASEAHVVLFLNSQSLSLVLEDKTSLKMKLIEGRFPDWKRVVPTTMTTQVLVDRLDLVESVKSAITLSNPKFRTGLFEFTLNECNLTCTNTDIGSYEEFFEVIDFKGDEMKIGFNLDYLLNALQTIQDENVMIRLNGDSGSALVYGENSDNVSSFHLVMPVRI